MMAAAAGSKVFILDKYFYELQRFWDAEKKSETLTRLHEETTTSPHSEHTYGSTTTPAAASAATGTSITDAGSRQHREQQTLCESQPSLVDDLVHLKGPLTEHAIVTALQTRFSSREFMTNIGPVLLSLNPYTRVGNPLTLTSTHQEASKHPQLKVVVQEAVKQKEETGSSQAIILSGLSGSGKTFTSMLLLRHLFDVAGGGPETDSFKHLSAALTVLRSLETAKTSSNSDSSRIGHFMEVQVSNGALYRTKIRSYFLDQTRIVKPAPNEKNYHIFYQMLAGLTKEERLELKLEGYNLHNLKYLSCGDTCTNVAEDAARFEAWKSCLSVLGIPFMDVVRIFAAILLLGNVPLSDSGSTLFGSKSGSDAPATTCEVKSSDSSVIKAVAKVLGVSFVSLYRGLTTRSTVVKGQVVSRVCSASSAYATRDALAKALYCRTVATIVRRANSLKRVGSLSGTLSSDSNESVHNHIETGSHRASTIGSGGAKSDKSMKMLTHAIRHANDGFIGILDMFGFEDGRPSRLEQLCINLTAETMQHFYNTHIFKSSIESCKEEDVKSDILIDYFDNVPCIDFISSLRTGLLSMLDAESFYNGSPQSYVCKIKSQHESSPRYFNVTEELLCKHADINSRSTSSSRSDKLLERMFGIRHFACDVIYDASDFLKANRDVIPDDLVIVFHKTTCSFGFANHLFGMEFKTHFSHDLTPKGTNFRISPTHTEFNSGSFEPSSTLTQDFHTRLDNLLRILVHARPHFVRCIKTNNTESANAFDRQVVVQQLRALQVLETVNLMAGGFSHRMKWRAFKTRYHCLAPSSRLLKEDENVVDYCRVILESFKAARESRTGAKLLPPHSSASTDYVLGSRHIFLSEGARQQLELMRSYRRNTAALLIQSVWRGVCCRRRWPALKRNLTAVRSLKHRMDASRNHVSTGIHVLTGRPRPQPITGTPPPESCDYKVVEKTCSLFGLDLENPPPVPPSRSYTVAGNAKLGYPQTRIMKMNFPATQSLDNENLKIRLLKGDAVTVIGASSRRGHLIVEYKNSQIHVPYQYMEFPANKNCSSASTKSASSRKEIYTAATAVSR